MCRLNADFTMPSDMQRLHDVLLDIMDSVAETLDKHNIDYYLGGGCALGSVRHGGFIPWDDDMDIAVFAENKEKLNAALSDLDPEKYSVQLPLTGSYCRDYYLISRKGTTYIINNRPNNIQRISLEIFPIYFIPDKEIEKKIYHSIMFVFDKMTWISESSAPNIIKKLLLKPIKYMSIMLDIIGSHGSKTLTEPRNVFYRRDLLPKNIYGTPTRRVFEDREYCFPEDINTYLTKFYGNYMQLPPEEKRVPRQNYGISFDIDYCDYTKESK